LKAGTAALSATTTMSRSGGASLLRISGIRSRPHAPAGPDWPRGKTASEGWSRTMDENRGGSRTDRTYEVARGIDDAFRAASKAQPLAPTNRGHLFLQTGFEDIATVLNMPSMRPPPQARRGSFRQSSIQNFNSVAGTRTSAWKCGRAPRPSPNRSRFGFLFLFLGGGGRGGGGGGAGGGGGRGGGGGAVSLLGG